MKLLKLLMVGAGLLYAAAGMAADVKMKTYILAEKKAGDVASITAATKEKLTKAGFEVVGSYSPYDTATILIVTNPELKANAKNSEMGAYGAAQRVTITKAGSDVQVAFTNPTYMANIYRMKGDLKSVTEKLKSTLGNQGEYGPEEGLTAEALRKYHYKFLMPYFDEPLELADYGNQQVALTKVEEIMASNNKGGVKKVYRIDMDGKDETVIGVSMSGPGNLDCSGDKYIMSKIDFKAVKSTGHLPYEVVISKGKVYALPAEFRIALSFPDLSMMGSNSFASIMCAPSAINEALALAVGGEYTE
ncbi:MAG: hypothetical protein OEY78_06745 [Gammaproteobacteria bacterium]|nr:hypothetical protein [Gammaproteobacteria bacterium]